MSKDKSSYAPKVKTSRSLLESYKAGKAELPKVLPRDMAILWIEKYSGGKIFGADVIKRTTHTPRNFVCRYGVRSHAKGVGLAYDPKKYHLTIIFDMKISKYRMICHEGLRGLLIRGRYHNVR